MTERINIDMTGPGYDLESKYILKTFQLLPDPPGIPFGKQGAPIPDIQQRHTSYREVSQMEYDHPTNPLPFQYWTGTSKLQINKGGKTFRLGVNEDKK